MTEEIEVESIASGQSAIVVAVSGDRLRIDFKYPNGNAGFITSNGPEFAQEVGDIILVNDHSFFPADVSAWSEPTSIGVIRRVYGNRLLVEGDLKLDLIPNRSPDEAAVGQTVVYSEQVGVRETLEDTPVSRRIGGVEDIEENRYLWKSDPEKTLSFDDFGGYPDVVARARELIETPLNHADKLESIRARPIKGVLFTGRLEPARRTWRELLLTNLAQLFLLSAGPRL